MKYPYSLLKQNKFPIFGDKTKGKGVFIDLSDKGNIFSECDIKDQQAVQVYADELMSSENTNWAISDFGERREKFFRELDAQQMVREKRFYHLGVDIWMSVNSEIFAPLDGKVVEASYEEGFGNYGGYIVLQHTIDSEIFYSFYGHLNPKILPEEGAELKAGDKLAQLGDMTQNGGYFYHTHLQILTQEGYDEGFAHKGYATDEIFSEIERYVLDPRYLII